MSPKLCFPISKRITNILAIRSLVVMLAKLCTDKTKDLPACVKFANVEAVIFTDYPLCMSFGYQLGLTLPSAVEGAWKQIYHLRVV